MIGRQNKKASILIIASRDSRLRYRFVSKPLELTGRAEITIFENKSKYPAYLYQSLRFAFRHKHFDMVIVCGIKLTGFVWLLLAKFVMRTKFVCRLGGDVLSIMRKRLHDGRLRIPLELFKTRLNYWLSCTSLRFTDAVVLVNRYSWKNLKKNVRSGTPCYLISQPVKSNYSCTKSNGNQEHSFRLLTVTNLLYSFKLLGLRKILDYLMGNFDKGCQGRHIMFDIVGGGIFLEDLKRYLNKEYKAQNGLQVNLHGYVKNTKLFYEQADVFIYCSTLDAVPNVILEAQSYGLPLLVNRYEPFYEIAEEPENALFFDADNEKDFCEKLIAILKNPCLREQMGINNVENVRQNYSLTAIARKWNKLIDIECNHSLCANRYYYQGNTEKCWPSVDSGHLGQP